MNRLEKRMVNVLKDLKEKHGAISVRAEFEAEGTRIEELLRLKEVSSAAGLGLTLKIGGCESIRDMLESRVVGVDQLVAPMVESPYALRKYLQAVEKTFSPEERKSIEILCNIETKTAITNFGAMIEIPEIGLLDGIVIERVDLCFSMGKNAECINDAEINTLVLDILEKAKKKNLLCCVGGGVSASSLPFFDSLRQGHLDRYETRKVCFKWANGNGNNREKSILKALGFEALWLRNKLSYYKGISIEDEQRMLLIEQRYWQAIDELI